MEAKFWYQYLVVSQHMCIYLINSVLKGQLVLGCLNRVENCMFITKLLQVLTQEDWNIVLFLGMQRTSHWAALYFVALMTFGNYVLFNLLVAILVEGFSSQVSYRK